MCSIKKILIHYRLEEAAAANINVDVVDEEFEKKKRLLEEELKMIDDAYSSKACDDEDLATKILSAAESIQELASSFGNDNVNLSPNIERLRELRKSQDKLNIKQDDPSFSSSSINAVPKTRFRTEQELFNTNSKRNTIGKLFLEQNT